MEWGSVFPTSVETQLKVKSGLSVGRWEEICLEESFSDKKVEHDLLRWEGWERRGSLTQELHEGRS